MVSRDRANTAQCLSLVLNMLAVHDKTCLFLSLPYINKMRGQNLASLVTNKDDLKHDTAANQDGGPQPY